MMRVKARWSGFIGSPGFSNFYFDTQDPNTFHTSADAPIVHNKVQVFFDTLKIRLPNQVRIEVLPDVEVLAPEDGALETVYNGGGRPVIAGGQPLASYSASTGAVVTWRTAGVRNGRRVRGRTFIVPLAGGAYGQDGTLGAGDQQETVAAATTLAAPVSGLVLGVWSRPSAPGANDGAFHPVTSATVPDMAAVLRSRRQ